MSVRQPTTLRDMLPDSVSELTTDSTLLTVKSQIVEPSRELLPYLKLWWEHRRTLTRAGAYSLVASLILAFLIPARFRSTTQLMPPDSHSSPGLGLLAAVSGNAGMGALGSLAGDLLGAKSSGELFVGILSSQTEQDYLIQKFTLQKVYRDSKIEDARKDLADHTEIAVDRKSGIVSITVTDHDPARAAAMAQAYVEELDRLVAQLSTSEARRERVFLEQQLQKVKADLDSTEKNFSDFASKNTAIDIPAQGKAMVQSVAVLQGELIAAQADVSGLQQLYSNTNGRVRSAQARVNELQKKLNEIGGQDDSGKDATSVYPSLRKLPLLGLTYADLFRQTKIQETVYELLTQQYEVAKVQEAKEIPSVKVLDAALVPTKKSFPPRSTIVIVGSLLGIVGSMVWIVGRTNWGAIDPLDPHKAFALDVFSTVRASMSRLHRNPGAASSNGNHAGAPGDQGKRTTSAN